MSILKHVFFLIILTTITTCCSGQSMAKSFSGSRAQTIWTYEFNLDNTFSRTTSGQNMDSLIVVNKPQFDSIVEQCTTILKTRKITDIKDADHIKIIRLLNSINSSQKNSFKRGIYADFIKLVKDTDYVKEISSYYDWIPSRGMGFYFQRFQIELGGKPHLYSIYTIYTIQ